MTDHTYTFTLTPLTPIHIGSGETLEPFEYVVAEDMLYRFALDDLMLALDADTQARLVAALERDALAARRVILHNVIKAAKISQYRMQVSPAAQASYHGRIDLDVQPEIATTARTRQRAYVPGSSLKGALRTALLYHAMDKPNTARDAQRLEQTVFGHRQIQEDPFRAFKVGDGPRLKLRTHLRLVKVHVHHTPNWDEKIPILVETLPGALRDGVEITSTHAVTVDETFYDHHGRMFHVAPARVLAACRDFYGRHLAEERAFLRGHPAAAVYDELAKQEAQLPDHACLVRLGWGSGHAATTVAYGLQSAPRSISRRLTEDNQPLGWAELRILDARGTPLVVSAEAPAPLTTPPSDDPPPRSLDDLRVGMELDGVIKNTVQYGAFVDIGIGRDGLIHISELGDGYVKRVENVVQPGDRVRVRVIDVNVDRGQFGLHLLSVQR